MRNKTLFIFLIMFLTQLKTFSQNSLPNITINYFNGKTVVSWLNDYEKNVTNIFIQRSFDSLKNFTTIGSVLIPQNKENGFLDNNPPFAKMYYRVSITFEGGTYEVGPSTRAITAPKFIEEINITDTLKSIITEGIINPIIEKNQPVKQKDTLVIKETNKTKEPQPIVRQNKEDSITKPVIIKKVEPVYPSKRIFSNKENNIIIELENPSTIKYHINFYDENNVFLFELTKITEDYLIIDKSNFHRSGWYNFEIFNESSLVEKNKFYLTKDIKLNNK